MEFKTPQTISLLGEDHLIPLVKYTSPEDKNQWKIKTDKQHLSIMNFSSEVTREQTKLYAQFFVVFIVLFFQKLWIFSIIVCGIVLIAATQKLKKEKKAN